MKVAKIKSTNGSEFLINNVDPDELSKLKDVESIAIVEMEAEDFWRIPATIQSAEFFAPITKQGG
jgi:hypothetical protein